MAKDKQDRKKSKYPKGDFRRFFETRGPADWKAVYEFAASIAACFSGRDMDDKTVNFAFRCVKGFFRYTSEFLGEKNGYLISAAALRKYQKSGVINARKDGPHFMEHLIPIGQFARELAANPTAENAEKLYAKQRLVFTLRTEQAEYEGRGSRYGKTFKSSRGDGEIKQFKDDYAIREFTGEGENAHE